MSFKGGRQTICLRDSYLDEKGKMHYSCRRLSLPGRMVCHKHAGQLAQVRRRRARNRVARATRKAQR